MTLELQFTIVERLWDWPVVFCHCDLQSSQILSCQRHLKGKYVISKPGLVPTDYFFNDQLVILQVSKNIVIANDPDF